MSRWWLVPAILGPLVAGYLAVSPPPGRFVLTLVLLWVAFRGWNDPRWAWGILVLTLGFNAYGVSAGPIRVLPEHVALLLLVRHWLAARSHLRLEPSAKRKVRIALLLMSSWFALAFLFSLFAPQPFESIRLVLWLLGGLGSLVVVSQTRFDPKLAVRIISYVQICYGLFFIVAWRLARAHFAFFEQFVEPDYASEVPRLAAGMIEPNIAASYLTLGLTVAICSYRLLPPRVLVAHISVTIAAVALTTTRAAWVVGALVLVVYVIRSLRIGPRLVLTAAASIAAIAIITSGPTTETVAPDNLSNVLSGRVSNLFETGSGTGKFRASVNSVAVEEISTASPLIGRGVNSFPQSHQSALTSTGESYLGTWWIALQYDTGVVGLLTFVGALAFFWSAMGRRYWPYFFGVAVFAAATNPFWYGYVWVFAAILLRSSRLEALVDERGQNAQSLPAYGRAAGRVPRARSV